MSTLNLLIFGKQQPKWEATSNPEGQLTLSARNVYTIDLGDLAALSTCEGEREIGDDVLSWAYLLDHTTGPDLLPLRWVLRLHRRMPIWEINNHEEIFIQFMAMLRNECQSEAQKTFLKKWVERDVKTSPDPRSLWMQPAIIPEVWINFQAAGPASKEEAAARRRTPFRLDFMIRDWGGQVSVVEIDGPQHYVNEEAIIETLTKSRYLTRNKWRYFRFHVSEIDKLAPNELWRETVPELPF